MQPLIEQTKVCNKCGEEKLIKEYHPNKTCSLGVVGTCRKCTNKRVNKWIDYKDQDYRDKINTRNRERKRRVVEHFGNKCHDCQKTFPQCVYEFHHLNPKEKDVNPSAAMTWSEKRMWKELEKCIMICSNCHKIRHWDNY